MPRGDQLSRQWRLLQLVDRPQGVTIPDAAAELHCTTRTIRRDLDDLQRASFPIYDDARGDGARSVWRVDATFRQQLPLKLSLAEVAALVMSRALLAPLATGAIGPAVTSAIDRIRGVLSKDALGMLDAMRGAVGVRETGAKLPPVRPECLTALQEAMRSRHRVRLQYYSMQRDEQRARDVDPYHLTLHGGGLYLVGHCHVRKAARIFAVERIRGITPLPTRFTIPAGFDVQAYLDDAWGIVRGELVTVRVIFARSVARYIEERLWHPSQELRTLDDGRVEITFRVADTVEVRRWILGYGAQAEVIAPASLREALRAEAEAMLRQPASTRRPLSPSTRELSASSPIRARVLLSRTRGV